MMDVMSNNTEGWKMPPQVLEEVAKAIVKAVQQAAEGAARTQLRKIVLSHPESINASQQLLSVASRDAVIKAIGANAAQVLALELEAML